MTAQNLVQGGEAGHWDRAIYAFLAENERRVLPRRDGAFWEVEHSAGDTSNGTFSPCSVSTR